jgi:type I restriction-modification system DNA methylase subunit
MLHGIDVPSNVRHDNTLARPLRDWGPKERVDVIVTNPPFGGMEEDGIEANYPAEFRTRETADLFLVLLMKVLKPGGRAGLVLPDGTLFGEGVNEVDPIIRTTGLDRNSCVFLSRKRLCFWGSTKEGDYATQEAIV